MHPSCFNPFPLTSKMKSGSRVVWALLTLNKMTGSTASVDMNRKVMWLKSGLWPPPRDVTGGPGFRPRYNLHLYYTYIQVSIMLHFLDRFNPIYLLTYYEIPPNIIQQLYNMQFMQIFLDLSCQHPQIETISDTDYSRMLLVLIRQ